MQNGRQSMRKSLPRKSSNTIGSPALKLSENEHGSHVWGKMFVLFTFTDLDFENPYRRCSGVPSNNNTTQNSRSFHILRSIRINMYLYGAMHSLGLFSLRAISDSWKYQFKGRQIQVGNVPEGGGVSCRAPLSLIVYLGIYLAALSLHELMSLAQVAMLAPGCTAQTRLGRTWYKEQPSGIHTQK